MESGRFAVIIVLIVALVGASAYYDYTQVQSVRREIADVKMKADSAAQAAVDAKADAASAKNAVNAQLASLQKAGDVAQLVKQASDSAAAAAKSAADAKAAADAAAKPAARRR